MSGLEVSTLTLAQGLHDESHISGFRVCSLRRTLRVWGWVAFSSGPRHSKLAWSKIALQSIPRCVVRTRNLHAEMYCGCFAYSTCRETLSLNPELLNRKRPVLRVLVLFEKTRSEVLQALLPLELRHLETSMQFFSSQPRQTVTP